MAAILSRPQCVYSFSNTDPIYSGTKYATIAMIRILCNWIYSHKYNVMSETSYF